jgi:hypothetical protein
MFINFTEVETERTPLALTKRDQFFSVHLAANQSRAQRVTSLRVSCNREGTTREHHLCGQRIPLSTQNTISYTNTYHLPLLALLIDKLTK